MKSALVNRSGFFRVIRVIVVGPRDRGGTNEEWFDPTCIERMKFDSDPNYGAQLTLHTAAATGPV